MPHADRRAFVGLGSAVRLPLAIDGAEDVLFRRPLHVIRNDEIELAVAIVVDPSGTSAELLHAANACLLGYVSERAIPVVVK